ncbi:MAG: hypothetical protein JXN65_07270 [Clostridia bacterium]|nr:hypothetical protein [Clostridia bacterium]
MKKFLKKVQIIMLAAAMFLSFGGAAQSYAAGADEEELTMMNDWLINIQLENGAMPMYGIQDGKEPVVPYFSSVAVIALLKYSADDKSLKTAEKYFDWYFGHMNHDGTIYDYEISLRNGEIQSEISKESYDSADSYAAFFLAALWNYAESGGSREYLISKQQYILRIIDLMLSLIDEDGFSRVSETNHTKYLMDNCEVSWGLSCADKLLGQVFLNQYDFWSDEYWAMMRSIVDVKRARFALNDAINEKLWNMDENRYEVGLSSNGAYLEAEGWAEFYPDAVAQLFPIVFGVIDAKGDRAQQLYSRFSDQYQWEMLSHKNDGHSRFYWGIIAYCGAMMGDDEKVNEYIGNFKKNVLPDFKYPAYNADVAWTLLAAIYKEE